MLLGTRQLPLIGLVAMLTYSAVLVAVHMLDLTLFEENSPVRAAFDLLGGQSLVVSVIGVDFDSLLLAAKVVGFSLMLLVALITLVVSQRFDANEQAKLVDLGQPIVFSGFFFMIVWMSQEPVGLCLGRTWFSDCTSSTHMFRFSVIITMIGLLVWATPSLVAALVALRNRSKTTGE